MYSFILYLVSPPPSQLATPTCLLAVVSCTVSQSVVRLLWFLKSVRFYILYLTQMLFLSWRPNFFSSSLFRHQGRIAYRFCLLLCEYFIIWYSLCQMNLAHFTLTLQSLFGLLAFMNISSTSGKVFHWLVGLSEPLIFYLILSYYWLLTHSLS